MRLLFIWYSRINFRQNVRKKYQTKEKSKPIYLWSTASAVANPHTHTKIGVIDLIDWALKETDKAERPISAQ